MHQNVSNSLFTKHLAGNIFRLCETVRIDEAHVTGMKVDFGRLKLSIFKCANNQAVGCDFSQVSRASPIDVHGIMSGIYEVSSAIRTELEKEERDKPIENLTAKNGIQGGD